MFISEEDTLVEYRRIPLDSLYVPNDYQRDFRQTWVDKRVAKFARDKLGTLVVRAAEQGKYAVIDGQHRTALARQALANAHPQSVTHLWCEVRSLRSRQDEANLFLARSDSRPLVPLDKFRAEIIAGDPVANAIKDIMMKHGVQIGVSHHSTPRNYGCILAIRKVYIAGELDSVIGIIEDAWGEKWGREVRNEYFVEGVFLFHLAFRNNSGYSVERATKKFSEIDRISSFLARAKNHATAEHTQIKLQVAKALVPHYNKNLSGSNRMGIDAIEKVY